MRIWKTVFGSFAVFASALAAEPQTKILFQERFEHGLSKRWEPVKFEGQTKYTVVDETGNAVLQGKAASSASGLALKVDLPSSAGTMLSWRWKLDKIPAGGSDDTKKTFDHTARIFVAFKTRIGPPRTVNYVWGNNAQQGTTYHHPSSGRARFIVLESGNEKAGKWQSYERDVNADWKKLFPDEGEPPAIVSIGLMTDSDGTKTTVTGWYDDFVVSVAK